MTDGTEHAGHGAAGRDGAGDARTERSREHADRAIGILETRGVVALAAGVEAMMKTADVQTVAIDRVSSGYLAAAVRGSLAAVRQAVSAGSAAVERYGELRSAQVYPKPHRASVALLENGSAERLARALESGRS